MITDEEARVHMAVAEDALEAAFGIDAPYAIIVLNGDTVHVAANLAADDLVVLLTKCAEQTHSIEDGGDATSQ